MITSPLLKLTGIRQSDEAQTDADAVPVKASPTAVPHFSAPVEPAAQVHHKSKAAALGKIEAPSAVAISPISQVEMAMELTALAKSLREQLSGRSSARDIAAVRQFEREARTFARLQGKLETLQSVLRTPT